MAEIENIRDWQGKDVLDSLGEKIGTVEDVYFDIETDEPRFLCVKAGWLRHRVVLVLPTTRPKETTIWMTRRRSFPPRRLGLGTCAQWLIPPARLTDEATSIGRRGSRESDVHSVG